MQCRHNRTIVQNYGTTDAELQCNVVTTEQYNRTKDQQTNLWIGPTRKHPEPRPFTHALYLSNWIWSDHCVSLWVIGSYSPCVVNKMSSYCLLFIVSECESIDFCEQWKLREHRVIHPSSFVVRYWHIFRGLCQNVAANWLREPAASSGVRHISWLLNIR